MAPRQGEVRILRQVNDACKLGQSVRQRRRYRRLQGGWQLPASWWRRNSDAAMVEDELERRILAQVRHQQMRPPREPAKHRYVVLGGRREQRLELPALE